MALILNNEIRIQRDELVELANKLNTTIRDKNTAPHNVLILTGEYQIIKEFLSLFNN